METEVDRVCLTPYIAMSLLIPLVFALSARRGDDAPIEMWRNSPGSGWKWREAISKAEASANMIVTLT